MRSRFPAIILSCLVLASVGCAPKGTFRPTPTSDEFPERARASLEAAILSRAPFDLDCPAEELTYKVLANDVVGVLGCGRRATYKHVGGTGWVLNNALDDDK
jgi:hypothetical protein